ncbi:rhomboid family intramembrane serine protease [Candidatus Uabimicrobium amorphum]|uniref:Peptidase S54 rhomboid domain-containing protein n=1 Tax=Uabimicrobium amorphum TaxID=2596890 RepID=A0A5S9ITF6_UABAM|nr:rhomboid family intramembrane serine protease [Candidatus Uabimicrobium amorphum]BBM86305.1 hypothetical protein UABAM_04691 [Candidatus Uabimicrobium amorphum]
MYKDEYMQKKPIYVTLSLIAISSVTFLYKIELENIFSGQRFFTLNFSYLSWWHFTINMLLLYIFGKKIESVFGGRFFLWQVLVIAVISQTMDYLLPIHIKTQSTQEVGAGMSGILCGLFAYAWLCGKFSSRIGVSRLWVIAFFLVTLASLPLLLQGTPITGYSHVAAIFAFAVGMLWAFSQQRTYLCWYVFAYVLLWAFICLALLLAIVIFFPQLFYKMNLSKGVVKVLFLMEIVGFVLLCRLPSWRNALPMRPLGHVHNLRPVKHPSAITPTKLQNDYSTFCVFIPPKRLFGPVNRYPFWGFFGKTTFTLMDEGIIIAGNKIRGGFILTLLSFAFIVSMFLLLALTKIGYFWIFIIAVLISKMIELLRKTQSEITVPYPSIIAMNLKSGKQLKVTVQIRNKKVKQSLFFEKEEALCLFEKIRELLK